MNVYLKLMRIDQYLKNIIVLLPLLFSGYLFVGDKIFHVLVGVLMFCLVSSAVYVMNDIADAKNDASNPAKCNRPIASGRVKLREARILCIALAAISISVSFIVLSPWAGFWIGIYFLINIFYSLGLKNIVVVDVVIIAAGFVIRAIYGTLIANLEIGVDVSKWFYFLIGALTSFTTLGKRLNEKRRMIRTGLCIRKVLEPCSERMLRVCLYLALILMNIFYIIWIADISTICETNPLWTIPFMILFSYKSFIIIIDNQTDHDPFPLFIRDKIWLITLIVLIGSIVITFYVEVPIINGDTSVLDTIKSLTGE